jgi:hypothetical protein
VRRGLSDSGKVVERRSRWSAVAGYAAVGALLVAGGALLLSRLVSPDGVEAVWLAALLAYAVQLGAFGALLLLRGSLAGFLAAWVVGTLMRFGLVLAGGLWLVKVAGYPPLAMMLSLTGFVFALLLLEPVFFRRGTLSS